MHLLLGKVLAQGDIFADRGVEKEHVLLDVAHLLLQLLGGVVFGVLTVKSDGPLVVREPAEEELQQRTLAAAGGAGEGVFAALLEGGGEGVQDRLLAVAEAHVFHADGVLDGDQLLEGFGLELAGVDGDAVEVGLCCGDLQALIRQIVQSIGDRPDEVRAGGKDRRGQDPLEDLYAAINGGKYLGNDHDEADLTVYDAFFIALLIGGLLHPVAGRIHAPAEPGAFAEEAQDIIPAQKVLQAADRRLLPLDTGFAQLGHPL